MINKFNVAKSFKVVVKNHFVDNFGTEMTKGGNQAATNVIRNERCNYLSAQNSGK